MERGWTIKSGKALIPNLTRRTRTKAIIACTCSFDQSARDEATNRALAGAPFLSETITPTQRRAWSKMYREGLRAVPVRIVGDQPND